MNILLSHPNLCKPTGETHQVFRGRRQEPIWRILQRRLCYDVPLRLLTWQNLFNPHDYSPRAGIPKAAEWLIDEVLYREKTWARSVAQNRFKYEGVEYTEAEIIESRLLSKNVNGAVFLTPLLRKMYPNATFFGLVRDGRALCESHLRRGASVEEVVDLYRKVGGAMLDYESTYSGFHLLKFENLVRELRGVLSKVYEKANLRFSRVRKVRLQIKEKTSSSGGRHLKADRDRKVVRYCPDELSSYFDPNINDHQISKLDDKVRVCFENRVEGILSSLGYSVE